MTDLSKRSVVEFLTDYNEAAEDARKERERLEKEAKKMQRRR